LDSSADLFHHSFSILESHRTLSLWKTRIIPDPTPDEAGTDDQAPKTP
jgi:hypothetical protein